MGSKPEQLRKNLQIPIFSLTLWDFIWIFFWNSNFFPLFFWNLIWVFFGAPIFFGASYVLEQAGLLIRAPIIDKWHSTTLTFTYWSLSTVTGPCWPRVKQKTTLLAKKKAKVFCFLSLFVVFHVTYKSPKKSWK